MKRGISLIELIVAMAIALVVATLATTLMTDTAKDFFRTQSLGVILGSAPAIRKTLNRFFDRGIGVAFTNFSGAPPANYQIFGNGGAYLVSDLRDCPAFSPGTSNIAANQTEILILCCSKNLSMTLNAPSPPLGAGATFTATSACQKNNGLSIEQRTGGVTFRKVCFEDIEQMDVFMVGQHAAKQTTLYQFDFFANTGKTRAGANIPKFNFRFGAYEALGNLSPLTVVCQ